MKNIFLLMLIAITPAPVIAENPEPKVEFTDVYQTHATVAGRLTSRPHAPMGVTIENGGIKYSTLTDPDGNWGLVFKYRSPRYSVSAFDLNDTSIKTSTVHGQL